MGYNLFMIHSLSGGVIQTYDKLTYVFVGFGENKVWYISPFPKIKVGDKVLAPWRDKSLQGEVLRVEVVTAQTAPFPVNRTREIDCIINA